MNFDHNTHIPGAGLAQEKYIKLIKDNGFDHIRMPIWFSFADGRSPEDRSYENIKKVAKMITDQGLYVFIDVHPLVGINKDPHGLKNVLYKLWEMLAETFKDTDEKVIFEIINEPNGNFDAEALNEIQNECIRIIRNSGGNNATRWIAAACAEFNTVEHVHQLVLPEDDENIFVTFHYYSPMSFSHQAAPWMKNCKWPKGATWGTKEEYECMENGIHLMAEWGRENNRHIHIGEFGIITQAEDEYRAAWTRNMVKLCEKYDIAWCYWDFCYSYAVYDLEKDEWNEKLRDALLNP